jgi:hypothetical protein
MCQGHYPPSSRSQARTRAHLRLTSKCMCIKPCRPFETTQRASDDGMQAPLRRCQQECRGQYTWRMGPKMLSVECMKQRLACSLSHHLHDDLQIRLSEWACLKWYLPHLQGYALRINTGVVLPGTSAPWWAGLRGVWVEDTLEQPRDNHLEGIISGGTSGQLTGENSHSTTRDEVDAMADVE